MFNFSITQKLAEILTESDIQGVVMIIYSFQEAVDSSHKNEVEWVWNVFGISFRFLPTLLATQKDDANPWDEQST